MQITDSKPKRHVMIDLETYDTKPTAVILSIGAVDILNFNDTFYGELSIDTQFERTASIATKEWWAKQGNPPIHGKLPLYDTLLELTRWLIKDGREPIVWCKGTDFDTAILTNAYQQLYLPVPWKYNNVRDCRTVFKIASWTPRKAGHNALQDALDQADDLLECLNCLRGVQLA